jgi:glucosamine-6-phosphate deaminase
MIMPEHCSKNRFFDRLAVEIYDNRAAMGRAAAQAAVRYLHDFIMLRGEARVIFACAPSQDEFLHALVDPAISAFFIDWSKVTAFLMDDYVGLTGDHPKSFRNYLRQHLLEHVHVGCFHSLPTTESDIETACTRYSVLLADKPIDMIFLGIGENGHLAFNDPAVASYDDPLLIKKVELDGVCRQQQVNDGCFSSIEKVPKEALTITIPVFRQATRLSICVPGSRKAAAVRSALCDPITPACPASILRLHPQAIMYLDSEAAQLL